jgi:transcriptional regulator with XRE-family HTH domain
MSDFAKRLRRLRTAKGLSANALAELTGLSLQGVLNLGAGGSDPKLSTVVKLAEALGVGPWELLPGRDWSTWDGRGPAPDGKQSGK